MVVYTCVHEWEAMLTCIYDAWSSGLVHSNIRLELEPVGQCTLFDEYIHVEPDQAKAYKVMDSVIRKISTYVYNELSYCSMAYEEDILDNIYHVLILGFNLGPNVLQMVQYKDIMRNREIRKRLSNELCRFQEFTRFHEVRKDMYVAHVEPKSKLVMALGPIFEDRMPSENWMIVDDIHYEAVVHPKDEPFYIRKLTEEEMKNVLETENANDAYTDLWKVFFDSIAIKERENYECQRNHMPLWSRKHAVEFV